VICSHCGAPVTASAEAPITVCEHCGSRIAKSEAGPPRTQLEDDLEHVEQWWRRERLPLMTKDRRGHLHPPEERSILLTVVMVLGMVLGLASAIAGHSAGWRGAGVAGFFLFPILITLPAALLHERAEKRFQAYEKLAAEYQGRKNAVLDRHARKP
jgi:hypothetical protein